MRWDVAHRVASIAAVQAHRDYGIDRDVYVDVFGAIRAAGIDCMAQPMPRLLGIYRTPDDLGPAILVNSGQDEIGIRHSAGHELGHHALKHSSHYDQGPFAQWGDGSWPDDEKTAEAFAAWFLMPLPAVRTALRLTGIERPRDGGDVYQIARWLGTSYAGTARHLVSLRLARPQQASAWARTTPASLRRRAQGVANDPPGHVWVLRPSANGAVAHVTAGDRLHLLLSPAVVGIEAPTGVTCIRDAEGPGSSGDPDRTGPLLEITGQLTGPGVIAVDVEGTDDPWRVTLIPAPVRNGHADAWGWTPDPSNYRQRDDEPRDAS